MDKLYSESVDFENIVPKNEQLNYAGLFKDISSVPESLKVTGNVFTLLEDGCDYCVMAPGIFIPVARTADLPDINEDRIPNQEGCLDVTDEMCDRIEEARRMNHL